MKKYVILIVTVVICLVLCLPVSSNAFNVLRTQVLGVVVGNPDDPASWAYCDFDVSGKQLRIIPRNGAAYNNVTAIRIFFMLPLGISKYSQFSINCSTSATQMTMRSNVNTATCSFYKVVDDNFTYKAQKNCSVVTELVNNQINFRYSWSGFQEDTNCYMLTFYFDGGYCFPSNPIVYTVNELYVNGEDYTELDVFNTSERTVEEIERMAEHEAFMFSQVVAPDLSDLIMNNQIRDNEDFQSYQAVIGAVSINNFLIPTLLIIVASFAFYSYVIFGRKG